MAVYQGARRRAPLPLGLDGLTRDRATPGASAARPRAERTANRRAGSARGATERARAAGGRRAARALAARRPSTVGVALAGIVLVFTAAFLSLSQSVRVAANGYDIVRLVSEHDRMQAIRQDLQADVERLGSEPAIRKQALDAGLGQLGAPLVVQAR
ncbi:MAG TPA: hypothetical protein VL749_04215 [Patescibacteria group bacterium]|jgi:hypothetical protein|nr:hypothetical protein [Patescibacteria group bacterium]